MWTIWFGRNFENNYLVRSLNVQILWFMFVIRAIRIVLALPYLFIFKNKIHKFIKKIKILKFQNFVQRWSNLYSNIQILYNNQIYFPTSKFKFTIEQNKFRNSKRIIINELRTIEHITFCWHRVFISISQNFNLI